MYIIVYRQISIKKEAVFPVSLFLRLFLKNMIEYNSHQH